MAIATKMDGVPGPLSGQFSNWPFEGVFGVGDCGIETRQNVANCTIFRTYATAVGKPGQFRNFLLKGATAFFERTAKTQRRRRKIREVQRPVKPIHADSLSKNKPVSTFKPLWRNFSTNFA
ncbi:MAG: hypothetical protein EAZ10_13245 [Oscillatoriales cyanobacterium]|nr:MAG: hypothetical protein EAZ10_13245 [Oscillatoriales cyanobacterium]